MESAHIPVYSERQAMDWSLVLASQEVPTTILRTTDGWALEVPPDDYSRALAALELYRKENRGWAWSKELPWPGVSFHFGAFAVCAMFAVFHAAEERLGLKSSGMMSNAAVNAGEWWRLFTAEFLHSDIAHLVSNIVFGVVVLGLSMARYGAGLALLGSLLAGAFGNLLGFWLYGESHRGLGASGLLMGSLGLLTVHYLAYWRSHPASTKLLVKSILAGGALFLIFGVNPDSDVLAHFGGFVSGCLVGTLMSWGMRDRTASRTVDGFAFGVFLGISVVTWALARGFLRNG